MLTSKIFIMTNTCAAPSQRECKEQNVVARLMLYYDRRVCCEEVGDISSRFVPTIYEFRSEALFLVSFRIHAPGFHSL